MGILVFISVLLVAACGLIYELVAGTLASYLVGDSVFQFSTIIGTYLFAMGVGSALSRYNTVADTHRGGWALLAGGTILTLVGLVVIAWHRRVLERRRIRVADERLASSMHVS